MKKIEIIIYRNILNFWILFKRSLVNSIYLRWTMMVRKIPAGEIGSEINPMRPTDKEWPLTPLGELLPTYEWKSWRQGAPLFIAGRHRAWSFYNPACPEVCPFHNLPGTETNPLRPSNNKWPKTSSGKHLRPYKWQSWYQGRPIYIAGLRGPWTFEHPRTHFFE